MSTNISNIASLPIGPIPRPTNEASAPARLDDTDLDSDGDHSDLVDAIIAFERWRAEFPQTKMRLRPQIDFFCAALSLLNRFEAGDDVRDPSFFDFSVQRFRRYAQPEVVRDLEMELHASRRLIRRLARVVRQAREGRELAVRS